jgi:phage I-like protein
MTWLVWALSAAAPVGRAAVRCKPCLIALAVIVALVGANWLGQRKARTECREAQMAAKLANQRADLENAKKAEADAKARAAQIEGDASDQRKEDASYIASLKGRPACDLTDDDISGLPNHRNRNGARPSRPAR